MFAQPHVLSVLAWAAQTSDDMGLPLGLSGNKLVLIVVAVALLLVTYYGMLIIAHWSKKHGKGKSSLGDMSFLDRIENKGGLTRDEMRRVREAFMRQALPGGTVSSEAKSGASVQDLMRIAAMGPSAVDAPAGRRTPPAVAGVRGTAVSAPPRPTAPGRPAPHSLNEILVREQDRLGAAPAQSDETGTETSGEPEGIPTVEPIGRVPRRAAPDLSPPAEGSGVSLDLDALLARGLIGPQEYNRLRALAQKAQDQPPDNQ